MQQDQPDPDEDDGSAYILLPDKPPEITPEPEVFYVHPDNWKAFRVLEACVTQWRIIAGMNGVMRQGLDYPSVMTVIDAWGIKNRRKIFNQVRLLEAGALSEFHEQQDLPDNAANSG